MNITIIGGHGKVALLATPLLVKAGHSVHSIIRKESQSEDIRTLGGTPVVADIESMNVEEITSLLSELNTQVLVWSAGAAGQGGPERTYAVDRDAAIRSMDAAEAAGVQRYIMVSYLGADPAHGIDPSNGFYTYAEAKAAADEHLRASSLRYTILGPGALADGEASDIDLDLQLAAGRLDELVSRTVARATVAAVLVAVIEDESTVGKALPFIDGSTPIAQALASAPAQNRLRP